MPAKEAILVNRVILYAFAAVAILMVLAAASYPAHRFFWKNFTEYQVESRLEAKGFEKRIAEKQTKYNSKSGTYSLEVRYEDEKEVLYVYEWIRGNGVLTSVYDEGNTELGEYGYDAKYILK